MKRFYCKIIACSNLEKQCFFIFFEMPDRSVDHSAVAYGIERMNREVSHWMRGLSEGENSPQVPFIATRGYDSVVWNRLYSSDISDLEDYQIKQASLSKRHCIFSLSYSRNLLILE